MESAPAQGAAVKRQKQGCRPRLYVLYCSQCYARFKGQRRRVVRRCPKCGASMYPLTLSEIR